MAVGAIVPKVGFNAVLDRMWNASTTITNASRFKIGTGTTTPALNDTDLTTPITAWNSGSDFKNYNLAPTFDTGNQKVTTQGLVTSTQANGNSITEYGEYTADASASMMMHAVITAITKTASVNIYFTTIYVRA